ncbi:gll1844 [Gloeobacter violaceus PCC 7421]|uniref:Gll1844 protein n=1 Tax=Gloeobacter violaceus (strain ATCC 29082 / PCC 7421) TaxID=251221 RepID=Q7NJI8_GLOVI|nr:gll1844 [Gloeobacter violaceus PCC 7421]
MFDVTTVEDKQLPLRLLAGGLLVAGIVAVFLLLFHPFLYVTEPGNATVMFNTFTGIEKGRIERPGATFVVPGVDGPITYNVRTRVFQFTNSTPVPNQAGNAITINTADGQAFSTDVFVALRPNQAVLDQLHANVGTRYMENIVVPTVRSKVRDVAANYTSGDFYNKARRAEMEQKMTALIGRDMPQGVLEGKKVSLLFIEDVYLGTAEFPEALKASLEQKQVASITAQTAAVKAQIQQKETTRKLILADANRKAIELQGQAAARNAKLADLLFYEKLKERIDAAREKGADIPVKVIRVEGAEKSTVFLNIDPQRAAATSAP